jgi:thiamine biosynthesis lipoprotein
MTTAVPLRRVVVRPAPAVDVSFPALGTTVRLLARGPGAGVEVARARAEILDYHRRLSRFLQGSELCALNADPRRIVPASALLRCAVRAGLWAADFSGGLVDPCLLEALEAAGYERTYKRPGQVLRPSGPYRAARPHPDARWREIAVDDAAGTIERPPGLRLDLGGSGKGHVADLAARHFTSCREWVVDCGGDIRIGGPQEVHVAHPLREDAAAHLPLDSCAVATSSVVSRAWVGSDGHPVHHLLDPSSGEPVRTGLLCATAVAPTTLHAETLAKVAVLVGPDAARERLSDHGAVLVHEDGTVETVEPAVEVAA